MHNTLDSKNVDQGREQTLKQILPDITIGSVPERRIRTISDVGEVNLGGLT
jgi:hypothetical protein